MPQSDEPSCPVCGNSYAELLRVERGDRWDDIYPGSPLSFFRRYRRRCTAPYDAETDENLSDDERAVYFHSAGTSAQVL